MTRWNGGVRLPGATPRHIPFDALWRVHPMKIARMSQVTAETGVQRRPHAVHPLPRLSPPLKGASR